MLGPAEGRSLQPEYRFELRLQGKTKHQWEVLGALAVGGVPLRGDGSGVRRDSRGGPCLLLSHEKIPLVLWARGLGLDEATRVPMAWEAGVLRSSMREHPPSSGGPSFGVSGAKGQGDLSKLPSMDWNVHRPTSASNVRSSPDRCANSPLCSWFEETLFLVGPAAADPRCSPLRLEWSETFHIPQVHEGELFGDVIRPLVPPHQILEPVPPGSEIVTRKVIEAPDPSRVGSVEVLSPHCCEDNTVEEGVESE